MSLKKGLVIEAQGARLELVELIREGGQAVVWKVREIGIGGRSLAAKIISCNTDEMRSRAFKKAKDDIENEIAILSTINHRFVGNFLYGIDFYDEEETQLYIFGFVMPFAPIGTLSDFLTDKEFHPREQLSDNDKAILVRRISQAISAVHSSGIVHSDIKAENILIQMEDDHYSPLIIDFGGSFHSHEAWRGMRTERYSAPEIEEGSNTNILSDIYALGVVVSEILSSTRQWQPTPELIETLDISKASQNYIGIVKRMLASDPDKRPEINTIWKAFHARENEQTTSGSSGEKNIFFPSGQYIWRPEIHEKYHANKYMAFLKSSNPTTDARLLRRVLDRFGFYGASVHRVFGNSDFYVETWITEQKVNHFKAALTQFQNEQPHHQYKIIIERYEYVRCVKEFKGKIDELEDVFGAIYDRYENDGSPSVIDRYIITENDPESGDIRFVLKMKTRQSVDKDQLKLIMNYVIEYLDKCNHITPAQKKITRVMGNITDSTIIISTPVKIIKKYTNLMLGVSRYVKKKIFSPEEFVIDYSTYIDMDGNGFFDGKECFFRDDGMIPAKIMEDYY